MTPNPPLEPKAPPAAEAAHEQVVSLELLISTLLRYGVLASIGLVGAGIVLSFVHHPDYLSSADALARLTRPSDTPHDLSEVLAGLAAARGQTLTMLGLLMLITLPVTRVGLSLIVFTAQKDRAFVLITGAVLALLLVSFLLGQTAA